MIDIIKPDWDAPAHVHAFTTTRIGGYSEAPFDSLNLADHVEDNEENVLTNRALLGEILDLPSEPLWLNQVHGAKIVCVDANFVPKTEADGSFAKIPNKICVVLTADCLPVLLTNRKGSMVMALHCGWRGLAGGIITQAHRIIARYPDEILAWLGPAISPAVYEVDDNLRNHFIDLDYSYKTVFKPNRPGHYLMDLYEIARIQLRKLGITAIYGGEHCTYREDELFYSFRRDKATGRMATMIWLSEEI